MKLFKRREKKKTAKDIRDAKDEQRECMFESYDENDKTYQCALCVESIACNKLKCPWWNSSTLAKKK